MNRLVGIKKMISMFKSEVLNINISKYRSKVLDIEKSIYKLENIKRKVSGSVTIYLSIVLVSVILLISIVTESGRVNASQTKSRSATYIATESMMAGYAKQVYKDYGVLLVWESEPAKEQIKKYIQDNINMVDLKGEGADLGKIKLLNVSVEESEHVTNNKNEFIEQIVSYMKYAGTINAVTKLVEWFESYSNEEVAEPEKSDVTYIVDDMGDELITLVEDINKHVARLKNTDELKTKIDAASQELELMNDVFEKYWGGNLNKKDAERALKKFKIAYEKILIKLDKEAGEMDETMELINQYKEKKELFIKENGSTTGDRDYIEENEDILKNVKDKIRKNKELAVSKYSEVDSKKLEAINTGLNELKMAEIELQSLHTNKKTKQDDANKSILDSAVTLLKKGVLSLVIEDTTNLSNKAISPSDLPSMVNIRSDKDSSRIELADINEKAILSLYADMKFGSYVNKKKNTALLYEMEYLLGGKNSDVDNLLNTVEKLIAVRNVINLAYLVTDKEKMSEISTISSSATAAIGIPFLEPVIKGAITEAWALAEAANDVKILLKNRKVPLLKKKNNWNTSLSKLLTSGGDNSGKKGLKYEDYLKLLLMIENENKVTYRIMDLIQVNVQKRYNSNFKMSKCYQKLCVVADFEIEPIFTAMPWVIKSMSRNEGGYHYQIKCQIRR